MKIKLSLIAAAMALTAGSAMAQTQGVSKNELVLGSIQDLSGPLAGFGKQVRLGMMLRADEANEQGGVGGRKIKLLVEDSGYDPRRAVLAAQKLVNQDKIFAMVGHIGTLMGKHKVNIASMSLSRDQAGGQVFLQGRQAHAGAVAAAVQALATAVHTQAGLWALAGPSGAEVQVQRQVGILEVHRGAAPPDLPLPVHQGVLHLQRAVVAVVQSRQAAAGIHPEAGLTRQPMAPVFVARVQGFFNQQATKARAIDEQIAFDLAAIGQANVLDKAIACTQAHMNDLALQALDTAPF